MRESNEVREVMQITDAAVAKIKELIDGRERGTLAVRVVLRGRLPGGGFQSEFKFVGLEDLTAEDIIQDTGQFRMYFDAKCAASIGGARVDFDERRYSTGFHIEYPEQIADNPASWRRKDWTDPIAQAVQRVIDEQINPGIAGHGGWAVLLDVQDGVAVIEMGGGCQGCGMSEVTLRQGIERLIMHHVPEIHTVLDQTEHEAGENPYYAQEDSATVESPLAESE